MANALAVCFFVSTVLCAYAQPSSAPEYEVKAAFLYNFAKFVEWPEGTFPDDRTVMNVCVISESSFCMTLESIQGKKIKGREIVVRQCREIKDSGTCHILFVCSSEKKRFGQILESVKYKRILTVGESEGFAHLGGIINFTMVGNKIAFEINIDAARAAGLKISSKLLKLAKIVREKP